MTYQTILIDRLGRRTAMNPRYSLRAFANALGLEPSKLSEILSGKKGLSVARGEQVAERLRLEGYEREVFLLSVQAQHSRAKRHREVAARRLKELNISERGRSERTTQKNAWYFGAIKACRKAGLKLEQILAPLRLTALQSENAERFLSRIQLLHPDKRQLAFEPLSIIKKINEDFAAGAVREVDVEFAFLSKAQAADLQQLLKIKIAEFTTAHPPRRDSSLYLFFNGHSQLFNKEELC